MLWKWYARVYNGDPDGMGMEVTKHRQRFAFDRAVLMLIMRSLDLVMSDWL